MNLYNDYADFLFSTFGDQVKYWLTFNEIMEWTWGGYGDGSQAPGRCSSEYSSRCQEIGGGGNSSIEPYIAAHHALLAHAQVVDTYRTKYQPTQGGFIGMTIDCDFALPYNPNSSDDIKSADDYMAFKYGWIADPLVFGKYPDAMTQYVTGGRLPTFSDEESKLIKGSFDFLGLDFYTSTFVQYTGEVGTAYDTDGRYVTSNTDAYGNEIGPLADNDWLYIYPAGIRGMLGWISDRYSNPPIYVFENGVSCPHESDIPLKQALNDTCRIDYITSHVANTLAAKEQDNADVRGYHLWSITDNFEWLAGYHERFGLVYIDYDNNLTRHLKQSAYAYSKIISGTVLADIQEEKEGNKDYQPTYTNILSRIVV